MPSRRFFSFFVLIFLISAVNNCKKYYNLPATWLSTPFNIMDKYENHRSYLVYLPENYRDRDVKRIVIYFLGSKCTNTADYFGNKPEHMLFLEEYAEKYSFIVAIPFPIYEYIHMDRICHGWVVDKEIDFINQMVEKIALNYFDNKSFDIYTIGLSAGGYMGYYYAYLYNNKVSGVFSHGKNSGELKSMIDNPSDINWRLGLAYNKYDFPDIISLVNEDYDYYSGLGIDVRIWRDCDENRHSWSKERTDEYFGYLISGE